MNKIEHQWKSVNLTESYSPGTHIDTIPQSHQWFRQVVSNTGKRLQKLRNYDAMDEQTVEISRALDIMAEDISSSNFDDMDVFHIDYDNVDAKLNKTTIKNIERLKRLWLERTTFDRKFFDYSRDVIKNGSKLFWKRNDWTLKPLVDSKVLGYVLDSNEEVTHYLYDNDGAFTDSEGNFIDPNKGNTSQKLTKIPVEDLIVLRVGDSPLGESLLERVYGIWRRLQMLEDSVVIYRVVRAPERRAFYIDTGSLPTKKATAYVNEAKLNMRQKQISKGGDLTTEFDPFSVGEDYYIPQSGQGRGSKIETLQGGSATGEVNDVRYFAKKLAMGLRIPSSMADTHSEGGRESTFNDGQVGRAYQEEMRYMGHISRIQRALAYVLTDEFKRFCRDQEFVLPEGIALSINQSQSFAMYKQNEVNQQIMNVFNSVTGIQTISKRYAMSNYLFMEEDDLVKNEDMMLKEYGLDDEQIKSLSDTQRYNIVYGDGRLGKDFGITKEESGFGGF